MGKKRSNLDIVYDMLRVIQKASGKIRLTHLMYKANLSYAQMKKYLKELSDKGFILSERDGKNEYISLTEKGYKYILKIKEMKEFEETFGL
jgi:predicted transcriptional regulator